ncbi:MAG: virulence RhuM family protein [Rickettsiales bacterium]|jgi:hypothetical protein|nr:virulence RhuM family protein [Rickettsiales bacterium]
MTEKNGNILIYQTEDGRTKIDIRLEDDTLWLSQKQIAELFQITKQTVGEHINDILDSNELSEDSVVRKYLTTAEDGKKYSTLNYSLDMILAVGYRVRSHRGAQFRRWATEVLKEYMVKGFALDDRRLKSVKGFGKDYFDELLGRIGDIRSSEKRFYQKILDIYATSVDYDGKAESSRLFFRTVQNKMHYSISKQTAAEIIYNRVDSKKPNAGLTNFDGSRITKDDMKIAKNYLSEEELTNLNRIVTAYLDFAELQARNHRAMHMSDWVDKLDEFLKLTGHEALQHSGVISHRKAITRAIEEYNEYRQKRVNLNKSRAEVDFEDSLKELEDLGRDKR